MSDPPRQDDLEKVARLLGKPPAGSFQVVVRDRAGDPLVILNSPLLHDGTPMPTRYWLVGRTLRRAVDRLEAAGGVRAAERAVDPALLAAAHLAYQHERDSALPPGWSGARPSGGVGGTRRGVKCLHAHYAWYLAGGDDPVGRWVARQLPGEEAILGADAVSGEPVSGEPVSGEPVSGEPVTGEILAAIDCGTNSTRLLVEGPGGESLQRRTTITRLGQGVADSGRLDPAAIERTLQVLRTYRYVMDAYAVTGARITATSAARDAANRDDFLIPASEVIGVKVELLAGEDEGRLSFAGATAELPAEGAPWLVADIGGGSTELVVGGAEGPQAVRSLDLGCVRVTENFLAANDPPRPDALAGAGAAIEAVLVAATSEQPLLLSARTLVGLAGTVSSLAAMDLGLTRYERDRIHHHRISRGRVHAMLDQLAAEPAATRAMRPGMEPGRADVIVGGALVLAKLIDHVGAQEVLVSESDILDGLVASLRASRRAV
ncbi:MAG: DUF501 domain-containing protein [Acidimicrobiales bacterium]